MPTRGEQVAQIEAALRARFFPFVPKVERADRAGWTEAQHDLDRLSRSLAAFAIVSLCKALDLPATAAVTDGVDDGGIDAMYLDGSGATSRLVVVQSKFKPNGATPSQAEIQKTINGVRALIDHRFDEFNDRFRDRLDEIEEALNTPGLIIHIAAVYLGENFSPHAEKDLNAFKLETRGVSERVTWAAHGAAEIHGWLVAEQTPTNVNADIVLQNWVVVHQPRLVVYGQMSAASLAELVSREGAGLFQKNVREYLGSVAVNNAIEQTVTEQPADLFYLNNGLTAVAEAVVQGQGRPDRPCTFSLKGVSIVNGAQTAGSISNAAMGGAISADAKLLVTIIEIGTGGHELGARITKARNHQTRVRTVDFAALDPTQERLRRELAANGITYHYRPSAESQSRRDDAFAVQEAAVAIASLGFPLLTSVQVRALETRGSPVVNAVDFVVTAKKEMARLWDQDGTLYPRVFSADLAGLRVCRLVRIYRQIDFTLAGFEGSEHAYVRRMFFRHGRHFIAAFVGHRCSQLCERPDLALTSEERQELSRQINALSEIIFDVSQPLTIEKGYLSIFRNLTDAQSLADDVLERLGNPPPVPVATPTTLPPQTQEEGPA